MSKKPIIKIEKLGVTYFAGESNEVRALEDINLEIYPEEFIIFFGPSGCGKSTLLYAISGLETSTSGNILIDNKNLVDLNPKELEDLHKNKMGMIFQAYYLINSLSVLDNVALPNVFLGDGRKKRKEKAFELLEHFGVKSQANKLPTELSGGQQQRVAICRSLMNNPDILMADEPVGNLDSKSAQDVMYLLKDLNERQKKTVILVTHDPAHLNYAHRIFYMKDGKVIKIKANEKIDKGIKAEEIEPTVSKDMELLLRTYSSLSSANVGELLLPFKAKQIVSEVLTEMTMEEINNIENKVERLFIRGVEDNDDVLKFFDIDIEKGGMGMDRRTAVNLVDKVKSIIREIKLLEKDENKFKEGLITDISDEMAQIRNYLLNSFDVKVKDPFVLAIINKIINRRIKNEIDGIALRKILDLPIKKGGAGLDKRVAKKLSRRLELLILGKFR